MNSQTGQSLDRFATTRWSLVMQPEAPQDKDSYSALVDLCQRYWYPVYAYVRCCGHLTVAAQDISRQFLLHLLREFQLHGAPSSRKHYRNYLLERLQAFLAGDRSDPTTVEEEARLIAPADLEPRYQHDRLSEGSPEEAFQRSFALEVLSRAFRRLRTEAKQTDHLDMFVALEPYLAHDPDPGEYEVLAARLRRRPLILALALKRLRERLRELTGEELADTVSTAEDLAGEQATLLEILRDRPS